MGNEIKKDSCHPKHCTQKNLFAEALPTLFASLVVAFLSGSSFRSGGIDLAVVIAIEVVVVFALTGFSLFIFRGQKKRLAETYISVCENGVHGVCPVNGFKNREFSLRYNEIQSVSVKGERLSIRSQSGNVNLLLQDAANTCTLIQRYCQGA